MSSIFLGAWRIPSKFIYRAVAAALPEVSVASASVETLICRQRSASAARTASAWVAYCHSRAGGALVLRMFVVRYIWH